MVRKRSAWLEIAGFGATITAQNQDQKQYTVASEAIKTQFIIKQGASYTVWLRDSLVSHCHITTNL